MFPRGQNYPLWGISAAVGGMHLCSNSDTGIQHLLYLISVGLQFKQRSVRVPQFVFFSPLLWLYNWQKSLHVLTLCQIVVNLVAFEVFLVQFLLVFSWESGRNCVRQCQPAIIYTLLLCCEYSHSVHFYIQTLLKIILVSQGDCF